MAYPVPCCVTSNTSLVLLSVKSVAGCGVDPAAAAWVLITVVLPEFVPAHWWESVLHNQTALRLKRHLLFRPGVVVTNVPYHQQRQRRAGR